MPCIPSNFLPKWISNFLLYFTFSKAASFLIVSDSVPILCFCYVILCLLWIVVFTTQVGKDNECRYTCKRASSVHCYNKPDTTCGLEVKAAFRVDIYTVEKLAVQKFYWYLRGHSNSCNKRRRSVVKWVVQSTKCKIENYCILNTIYVPYTTFMHNCIYLISYKYIFKSSSVCRLRVHTCP